MAQGLRWGGGGAQDLDVNNLRDLKDKTILVVTSGRSTWWPWLKQKYGLKDEQARPYTSNMPPFFADRTIVQQGFPSSEIDALKPAATRRNVTRMNVTRMNVTRFEAALCS